MNPEYFVGSVIRGLLGGSARKKKGRRAARFLAGGGSSLLKTSTLLTVAGVAWGLWESAQAKTTVPGSISPAGAEPGHRPGMPQPSTGTPPPLPPGFPPEVLRLVRLAISAARADSQLSPGEREEILALAREAGAESLVQQELQQPAPVAAIVAGVEDPRVREELYTLAFGVVHADEGISGAERIYLAQLAQALNLGAEVTSRLEQAASQRIAGEPETE